MEYQQKIMDQGHKPEKNKYIDMQVQIFTNHVDTGHMHSIEGGCQKYIPIYYYVSLFIKCPKIGPDSFE